MEDCLARRETARVGHEIRVRSFDLGLLREEGAVK